MDKTKPAIAMYFSDAIKRNFFFDVINYNLILENSH